MQGWPKMRRFFSLIYDFVMIPFEKCFSKKIRKKLVQKAYGNVLEIGSGTGLNFPFYQRNVNVVALEPNKMMRKKSLKRLKNSNAKIDVQHGIAESLPYGNNTFDTIIATLVFCSVSDPHQAFGEIQRVCKKEGQVLLFEHVILKHLIKQWFQHKLTPFWKVIADGCHLNRDTEAFVKKAGFSILERKTYMKGLFIVLTLKNEKE